MERQKESEREREREEQRKRERGPVIMGQRVSPLVATADDMSMMSTEALRFVQQGNANGLWVPQMPSGVPQFWGTQEELMEMARERADSRNSNRAHVREVNDMAAGGLRERAARNMYRRW